MSSEHNTFDLSFDRDNRKIFLIGDITEESVAKTMIALSVLNSDDRTKSVALIINSCGGDYTHGIGLYDFIYNGVDYPTIGYVFGSCMSTASVILQACETRYVSRHSTLMVHNGTDGAADVNVIDYERWADHAKIQRKQMYLIYALRSDKTAAYWEKKCTNDYILTAEEAINEGLADRLI